MNDADKQAFRELMEELGNAYGQEVGGKLKAYWRVLSPRMDIETLAGAVDAHMADPQRGRFFPLPADLIAACQTAGGHPGADEAWAICLESLDEAASVVITDQILAARSAAQPVMDAGDEVGARMAFKGAYEREVKQGPAMPQWRFSAGHDPARRADAAERALQQGLLPRREVERHLPGPAITDEGRAIAGLLTGNVVAHPASESKQVRARLAEVKQAIASAADAARIEREARERERDEAVEKQQARRHGMSVEERAKALEAELEERKRQRGAA